MKGTKKNMSTTAVLSSLRIDAATCVRNPEKANSTERYASFSKVLEGEQKKCPYGGMAEDGLIEYNGVTFVCDYKSNSICLGDMSKPNDVLCISLPSGGHLKVNVNNFGELSNAAGMFSATDLAAIMRAIAQYNHCTRKVREAEDEEIETVEENAEHAAEVSSDNKANFSNALKNYQESHKLSAQELKEEKDWRDMSSEEWDKMMEGVDNYLEAFREKLREMKEMQEDAAQKAALEADSGMKTLASSAAALAVANGFDSGSSVKNTENQDVLVEDIADREKNWTKTLKTDNQTILMTAKEAQKMERNAMAEIREIQLNGVTTAKVSVDVVISKYMRNLGDDSRNNS